MESEADAFRAYQDTAGTHGPNHPDAVELRKEWEAAAERRDEYAREMWQAHIELASAMRAVELEGPTP